MSHTAYIEKKLGKEIEQVSREELIALVNEMKNEKKYGLVWENQVEEMEKLLETHYPMIQEDADKAIVKDPKKPTNLIIEGDNLHSLNTLLYTHREKVDVIYIDPPYNTGNKDFVYNDRYVDKENSWRHSSWLSFIEKRLRLAKELLSEDGIIFISIDDYEMSQLKLLSDEIFGEHNFLTVIKWFKNINGRQLDKYFANTSEYVLAYARNRTLFKINQEIETSDLKLAKYKFEDETGVYKKGDYLSNNNGAKFNNKTRPNLTYAIYYNPVTKTAFTSDEKIKQDDGTYTFDLLNPHEKEGYIKILPPIRPETGYGCWRWGMDKFNKEYNTELIFEVNTKSDWKIYKKNRVDDDGIVYVKPKDYIKVPGVGGNNELSNILGKNVFDHPKPLNLIKWLVERHTSKNAIILDFFAGSGTTGHSVLELNDEDGGNRQFILCTHGKESESSEVNIAEDITYERIKRVIEGYTTPKGKEVNGIDGNVKYYKTVLVEKDQDVNDLKAEMAHHAKDLLCIKDNAFAEVVSSEESFLFESNDVLMGIHLGEHYEVPKSLTNPLTETDKQKILYLKVDEVPADEEEINVLLEANIVVKPIPKKIMDLFDENTRQ